ncbi:MAG: hypothetical protein KJO66_00125, partial [Gammaproteobacteria bacterium]|nr:hypothetical protein [Gammaproteobacteria bacterium]
MEFSVEALKGLVLRLGEYATPDTGVQLAVIVLAVFVAWSVHHVADRALSARLDRTGLTLPREVAIRLARRLVFPLAALLVVLAGLFVLQII